MLAMAGTNGSSATPALARRPRTRPMPDGVLGMLIFVVTELMFFAGMMSAHTIVRAGAFMGVWPPADQPRLPVEATAVNTVALLLSGVLLALCNAPFKRDPRSALRRMTGALLLGTFFVVAQGWEWVGLIREGLTLTSSTHGGFFYLIVGTHALHAVVALLGLAYVVNLVRRGSEARGPFLAAQVFWYFVVLLWPIIYGRVYF